MSETHKKRYHALLETVKQEIPGFKVEFKDTTKDKLFLFIAKIVCLFNKGFMTRFTTTLYPKVYFPYEGDLDKNYKKHFYILAHEFVHLYDRKKQGILFSLSYLFPQILSLLSVLALGSFWCIHFLWFLLFLIFLLPLPSYFRTKIELRGYKMNVFVRLMENEKISDIYLKSISENFSNMNYYKMCSNKEKIKKELQSVEYNFIKGIPIEKDSYPYNILKAIIRGSSTD